MTDTNANALREQGAHGTTQQLDSIPFSFGRTQEDNYPCNCTSNGLEDFGQFLEDARSPRKGLTYIAGQMGGDCRRCKDNALPSNLLRFDIDGSTAHKGAPLSNAEFERFKAVYQGISRILYPSSSDKPEARRFRQILLLDMAISRADAMRLGKYLSSLTPWVELGEQVFRHEQPIFCPVGDAQVQVIHGEPLCVAEVMAQIPRPKIIRPFKPALRVANGIAMLDLLKMAGLYLKDGGSGKHLIVCPWHHLHSDGRNEAAYFEPSHENNGAGGFRCLHSHCEGRTISDLIRLLKEVA